jgi:tetratricopeptide (TPR) repeat protein
VLLEKAPFALVGILFALQAAHAQTFLPDVMVTLSQWPVSARLAQAAYGLGFYIWKLLWPTRLAALYELPVSFDPADPRWAFGLVSAALLITAAVALRRRLPAFTAAAAAYAVLVSPVLGLMQSGIQLVADRYSYVANIPWAILAGGGILWLLRRLRPPHVRWLATAGCIVAVALAALSWRQTRLWRDTGLLFAHALALGQEGPMLRWYYGVQLAMQDRKEDALRQFDRSIELDARHGGVWFSRANALKDLGRYPEAEAGYKRAATLMRDAWRADVMLGIMYHERLDRLADARAAFESAVARIEAPGAESFSARPYLLLAAVLDESGDQAGCRRMLEKAAEYVETRDEALQHLRDMGR